MSDWTQSVTQSIDLDAAAVESLGAATAKSPSSRALSLTPKRLVGLGVLVVAAGFGLIAITWAAISPLKIVAQQLPYLVSAGFTGVGLIVFGSAMLIAASKRADDAVRSAQSLELVAALRELRETLDLDAAAAALESASVSAPKAPARKRTAKVAG